MKIVAIDIETTGLDETYCQILEFGAIAWELLPGREGHTYGGFCRRIRHRIIKGQAYALHLNAQIIKELEKETGPYPYVDPSDLWKEFMGWVSPHKSPDGRVYVTGKNFGSFDRRFLAWLPGVSQEILEESLHYGILDPGSLYFDPRIDTSNPRTLQCASRAGLAIGKYATHTTLGDCQLVLDMIEAYYRRR